jgi:hypothetical protein
MTCFLCLKRSLALRNSRLNSERLRQQMFLSSTYVRCFQIPSSGFSSGRREGKLLYLQPRRGRSALQELLYNLAAMDWRAVPDDQELARALA